VQGREELSRRELVRRVHKLDLEPIVYTLTERPEPGRQCVDLAIADMRVDRYRLFLVLAGLYPDVRLVPTSEIDMVWRCHVLDSGKYTEDCQTVFDTALHRFPYTQPGSERDARLATGFAETARLFEAEFEVVLTSVPAGAFPVLGERARRLERPRPRRRDPT
jgi:hypothetical protein